MMPVDHCASHDSQSFAFANFVGDIDLEMIMGRGRANRCAMRVVLKEHIGGAKKLFSYSLFNQSSETRYRRPSLFHHNLVSFFSFSFHWYNHTHSLICSGNGTTRLTGLNMTYVLISKSYHPFDHLQILTSTLSVFIPPITPRYET